LKNSWHVFACCFGAQWEQLNALERGEGPVLESSEEPADGSYLAFPDLDMDALRNPAYASQVTGFRSTSTFAVNGSGSRERFELGTSYIDLNRSVGHGTSGHSVSLSPLGRQLRLGLSARGSSTRDHAAATLRSPFPWAAEKHAQKTNAQIGEFQTLIAHPLGAYQVGISAIYRRSDVNVVDTPLGGTDEKTNADNRLGEVQLGLLFGQTTRKLGLKLAVQNLNSTTISGPLRSHFDGYNYIAETLMREQIETNHLAGLLRFELTKTQDTITDAGQLVYNADRSVRALKGGLGWGQIPTRTVVFSLDLVGGLSKELATQHHPDGSILEDENDLRLSLSAHIGTQIHVGKSIRFTMDATHRMERQSMKFHLLPGSPGEIRQRQFINRATTSAISSIGYVG
jgi:hypothetical protein